MSRAENMKKDKKTNKKKEDKLKKKEEKLKAEQEKNELKIKQKEVKEQSKKTKKEKKEKKVLNSDSDKGKTNKSRVKKLCIVLIVILSIIFLAALSYFIYDNFIRTEDPITKSLKVNAENFKLNIVDLNSNTRPFAVMIDNNPDAWPQFNVNEAIVVYEMLVEGGMSRLLAIFKDRPKLERIGPLRSARHYFLDYVKEYDAIYVHEGHSPRAGSEVYSRNIDSVEYTAGLFYRDQTRWAPHNAITSSERITKAAKSNGFSLKTKKKMPLKYSILPVKFADSISATTIEAGYSYTGDLKLIYNEKTMKYEKYEWDELLKDAETKEALAATNILILKTRSYPLTGFGAGKSRVHVETDREMSGYYFTNGEGVKIKANKATINSQTKYTLLNGKPLAINDGNTFVFIIPDHIDIKIKGSKKDNIESIEKELEDEEESTNKEALYLEEMLEKKNIKIIRETF